MTSLYPLLGVVTPVHNRRDITSAFARTFLDQDYPHARLYVIDSGSTDGTRDELLKFDNEKIVLLDATPSSYWTAATNIGVRQALADNCVYVVTINDDAIIANDFLSSIVRTAQEAQIDIVGSIICYADDPARIWGVGATTNFDDGDFLQTGLANTQLDILPRATLVQVDALCGNGTLIHHSLYRRLGLYNARMLPHYHADVDFSLRVKALGRTLYCSTGVILYNRFREKDNGSHSAFNAKFFSVKSANYIKAVAYIIFTYCHSNARAASFIKYYGRYLTFFTDRNLSQLLRFSLYLSRPNHSRFDVNILVPPSVAVIRLKQDIDLLMIASSEDFATCAYPRLLRRVADVDEVKALETVARTPFTRLRLLQRMLSSSDFEQIAGHELARFAQKRVRRLMVKSALGI